MRRPSRLSKGSLKPSAPCAIRPWPSARCYRSSGGSGVKPNKCGGTKSMKRPSFKSVETKYYEEREALFRGLKNLDRRTFLKLSLAAAAAAAAKGVGFNF